MAKGKKYTVVLFSILLEGDYPKARAIEEAITAIKESNRGELRTSADEVRRLTLDELGNLSYIK